MDEAAFPSNATCYRSLAQEALGPRIDERYQLRLVDHVHVARPQEPDSPALRTPRNATPPPPPATHHHTPPMAKPATVLFRDAASPRRRCGFSCPAPRERAFIPALKDRAPCPAREAEQPARNASANVRV